MIDPRIEVIAGDVRDPTVVDALFDGIGRASVFHAAAVIHPAAIVRELFDVNVGGTQLVLDRARRVGAARFVHVSSNSPFGANRSTRRPLRRGLAVRAVHGLRASKLEAEAARAAQLRPRRPRDRHRAPAVVLRTVPTRAPDAVLRGGPARPLPACRRRARSGGRWSTRATSCRACCSPRSSTPRRGHAYWIADAEPYELRDVLHTVRDALAAEGLARLAPAPAAGPAVRRRRWPRSSTRALQASGRYVQAVHVLGELKDTIACDISRRAQGARLRADGRVVRGHARRACAGASSGADAALMPRSVLVTGGSGYFGTVLAERALARGDAVRIFDVNPPGARPAAEFVARRRARPRARSGRRAKASTSCSTTSRRCRSRRIGRSSTR